MSPACRVALARARRDGKRLWRNVQGASFPCEPLSYRDQELMMSWKERFSYMRVRAKSSFLPWRTRSYGHARLSLR